MTLNLKLEVLDWMNDNTLNSKNLKRRFPEVEDILYSSFGNIEMTFLERLHCWLLNTNPPICINPICNNKARWLNFRDGYAYLCAENCKDLNINKFLKNNDKFNHICFTYRPIIK